MTTPRPDANVLDAVEDAIRGRDGFVVRRPYRYATSATLEEVSLELDGAAVDLILKDLAWCGLLDGAKRSKPAFLHEPRREEDTYIQLLGPEGIGPTCYGTAADGDHRWLVLERVPGVELWQVGDVAVWEEVARWLATFHRRFSGRVGEVRDRNPALLEFAADWFVLWRDRAAAALGGSDDDRARRLVSVLARYHSVVDGLSGLPRTFVHGEFYPSNVIVVVGRGDLRVCPVDWEMAALGPAALDLAALVSGWDPTVTDRIVSAYGEIAPADLQRARLHLAVQWLGWSSGWSAPAEHARDWLGEALAAAEALDL